MLLYIIRHGDPDYATDSLTPRGVQQAEAVAKRLADAGIDRIFSSPMGRARQTAEPTCRLLGLSYEVEDWTREISPHIKTTYPDGRRRSVTRLQNTYYRENGSMLLDYDHALECPAFALTTMGDILPYLEAHGKDFLERLGYREEGGVFRILNPNEQRVALFCHGAFSRAWLSILLHIPVHMMWSNFSYTHTGVTVLEFKNNENGVTAPKCLCFSDVSHLYAQGLDMIHDNDVRI